MTAALLTGAFGYFVFSGHVLADGLIAFTLLFLDRRRADHAGMAGRRYQLVARPLLPSAVALNSIGLNVSRALGPALAGIVIAAWGIAAPFWVNALTTIGVVAALIWWQPSKDGRTTSLAPGVVATRHHLRIAMHVQCALQGT